MTSNYKIGMNSIFWCVVIKLSELIGSRVDDVSPPASGLPPDVHIYTHSKLPWVRLPENAKAFEAYYDMAKEWLAESLARRAALLGEGK